MSQMQIWETYRSLTRDSSVKKRGIRNGTVNRVLEYAKPLKKDILLLIAIVVIDAFLVVAQPLLFKRIIDDGITAGNKNIVITTAIYVGVLAILSAGLSIIGRLYSSRIGEGLILTLRTQVFNHVQAQPIAFFTRTQTGSLISRVNGDVIGAQQAFTSTLSGIISNGISLIIVLSTMIILSWQITLTSLILLPVFLIPAKWMGKRVQSLSREQMTLNAEMSQTMTERFNVSGALLVKLFGDPIVEGSSFFKKASRVKDIGVRIAMTNMVFFVALTTVATIATAIVYGFGGSLVISGDLTLGTLLALTALLARLYGPLTSLSNVRVDIMTALVSFERVFEVLDSEEESAEAEFVPSPPVQGRVAFENVSFSYNPDRPLITDLSLVAEPGTTVAIVGPTGAGKTTLVNLIMRFYELNNGRITLDGRDISLMPRSELRSNIGMVLQDTWLFGGTIRENIAYGKPSATEEQIRTAAKAAYVHRFVQSLPMGYDTVLDNEGGAVSAGEKQLLTIARAFLADPTILILDEATSSVDTRTEVLIQRAMVALRSQRTSFVIAHRLSTIRDANVILVMEDGRIVEQGSHEELLASRGAYFRLYQSQFSGAATDVD